ncbi:MAG: glutamine-hydrolyzing carbamoyl-phosphate synthase small subunit [Campylobacterota bacterium]
MKTVYIYFENGVFLEAKGFGSQGTAIGEVVFNTSMTGYQEIATDPSYAGQFVTFTMPEIGNVGANEQDNESPHVHCKGVIVRNYQARPSSFRCEETFDALLKRHGAMGITDIDTRYITKMLRNEGAMMMIASTEISDSKTLRQKLEGAQRIEEINYIKDISTKSVYVHKHGRYDAKKFAYNPARGGKRIVCLDFGVKRNILNELTEAGFEVEVSPHDSDAGELIRRYENKEIAGIFLSNGPGDPLVLTEVHALLKKLLDAKVPMFGICLGHQVLSIASGYPTYKLKFGHHGGNHPVKNQETGRVEITAQNHNYNVSDEIQKIAKVTHVNLFDNTIEGVCYTNAPAMSVQHHPESSPGPLESKYIFQRFHEIIQENA